jgi:GTPase
MGNTFSTEKELDKAFLVGVDSKATSDHWPIESSMEELAALAASAGARIVGRLIQKLDHPSSTSYLGKGKLEELIDLREQKDYNVVIFNDELSPRQQKKLEDSLNVKVIDRTALILDIFAKRAQTSEGKLQVELAQLEFLLPRLAGQWSHLERLGGGIGTRGPGESQIETDRRIIRKKIQKLKTQLEAVRKHRNLYRRSRDRSNVPVVSLVGYTNAGKSTLMNTLTNACVSVENKLFCTLDPVTRSIRLANNTQFLITDTVGFINKLPPSIVAAFRATLEELQETDLLLHVIDITHKDAQEQFRTVESIIKDLKIDEKPRINVLNKIDLKISGMEDLEELKGLVEELKFDSVTTVFVSAQKGWGLDDLLNKISEKISVTQESKNLSQ